MDLAYSVGAATVESILGPFARGEGKVARGVRGRREAANVLESWAADRRARSRPLVWFHAPSVGEGLQARAVIDELRSLRPDVQIAYTFFSPSAEPFASQVPADVTSYLPPDRAGTVARVLEALAPSCLAFTKSEVWPNLVREADRRGIPSVLLSATLPISSSRLRWPARILLSRTHARLAMVAAISPADADRYAALGVPPERRTVMGDARLDQVARRAERRGELVRELARPDLVTLVAGSTWPDDEERMLPAFAALALHGGHLRLVLAPHEPTEEHLRRAEHLVEELGLSSIRLTAARLGEEAPAGAVLVVDRLGVLGDLYGLADLAYVGGGFGTAGLHSVLEPAAFGVPVLFGPHFSNAREAGDLIERGAAAAVRDAAELQDRLERWITDPDARRKAGVAAKRYVSEGRGAAERGARVILELLGEPSVSS